MHGLVVGWAGIWQRHVKFWSRPIRRRGELTNETAAGHPSRARKGFHCNPLAVIWAQAKRKRAAIIPTVMQDEPSMPPSKPNKRRLSDMSLTPEQVDPDFKGTPLDFATKYGHVNIHTKEQIEHYKRQEALNAWLGTVSDLDRARPVNVADAFCRQPGNFVRMESQEWQGRKIAGLAQQCAGRLRCSRQMLGKPLRPHRPDHRRRQARLPPSASLRLPPPAAITVTILDKRRPAWPRPRCKLAVMQAIADDYRAAVERERLR